MGGLGTEEMKRSDVTRERILEAARGLFAEQGFERTTIRAVACAAAINPSMVIRYYGSKEGLFTAATDIDLRIPDLRSIPSGCRGEAIVTRFLERWEGPDAGGELPVMLRAAASHEGARRKYLESVERQVTPMIASICPEGRMATCMGLISSQLVGLAMTRYVLRLPAVVALDRDFIVRRIGATIQGYLSSPDG